MAQARFPDGGASCNFPLQETLTVDRTTRGSNGGGANGAALGCTRGTGVCVFKSRFSLDKSQRRKSRDRPVQERSPDCRGVASQLRRFFPSSTMVTPCLDFFFGSTCIWHVAFTPGLVRGLSDY